jgi:hypothetical protein
VQRKTKLRGSLCSGLREILLSLLQGVNETLPRPTQGETIFPVHVVRMELDLYHFPHEQSRPESKEHHQHIWLDHLEKSAITEHSMNLNHHILLDNTDIVARNLDALTGLSGK